MSYQRAREIELSDERETFPSDTANLHFGDASAGFAALHPAIATLAPDRRLAINLLKLEEMSFEGGDAGKRKRRTVSASKVVMHRAIKVLRKRLRQTSQTP